MSGNAISTVYLAGGCFWGVEELFRQLPGVVGTTVGYANGSGANEAFYQRVCEGDTGFRETVRVSFDPKAISIDKILWAYFQIIDPTIENRQANDVGAQYQTGIYWEPEDVALGDAVQRIAEEKRQQLEREGRPFAVEVHQLVNFFDAEEYHQRYLVKNPGGYCHVSRLEMSEVLGALS